MTQKPTSLEDIVRELTTESKLLVEKLRASRTRDLLDRLGTNLDPELDTLAALAAQICGASIATIALLDDTRQVIKGAFNYDPGLLISPCRDSLCNVAIRDTEGRTLIHDTTLDPRVSDLPFVNGSLDAIRFYAGYPLRTQDDLALGTICVLDRRPMELSEDQLEGLERLRDVVVRLLAI